MIFFDIYYFAVDIYFTWQHRKGPGLARFVRQPASAGIIPGYKELQYNG